VTVAEAEVDDASPGEVELGVEAGNRYNNKTSKEAKRTTEKRNPPLRNSKNT
jgi:hypothetical protein